MARDTDPASSARRIIARAALLLVPIVASAVAIPHLLGRAAPAAAASRPEERGSRPPSEEEIAAATKARLKLAHAQRGWLDAKTIAPGDARIGPSGEVVRWFQGFGVSVDSAPAAARVLVNGTEAGATPLVASVKCVPGEQVAIEVRKAPFAPQRRLTTCRADTLVEIGVQLRR